MKKMKRASTVDSEVIGLRRFSLLSMSSTNLSLLDRSYSNSFDDDNFHNSMENFEESVNNNGSAKVCDSINIIPEIKIDSSQLSSVVTQGCNAMDQNSTNINFDRFETITDNASFDRNEMGLLKVEPSFIRSADAFASLSQEKESAFNVLDKGSDIFYRDSLEKNVIDHQDTLSINSTEQCLLTQSSVCRIDIETCSTDESSSDGEIDTSLLHSRSNSLSLLNLPERSV